MKTAEFSSPIRQSVKGILIIFGWQLYKFIRRFFVIFFALIFSKFRGGNFAGISTEYIILGLIVVILGLIAFAVLKYLNFKFYVTDDDFYLNSGIVTKDETRISKSKIQNVYIKQNFLQQIINVVSLTIETAGDNKSEIEINALDRPQALRLKKELFNNLKSEANIAEEPQTKEKIYFKATPKRLLLEGVSQNHLRSLAIIAAFFFGLFQEFRDFIDESTIKDTVGNQLNFENKTIQSIILFNIIAFVVLIFISIMFSVVKTFIINFNLKVIENNTTIEINKGLFNKIALSLTPSRIQSISISTNRLKRYFGLHRLAVKQAMVNKKLQSNFSIVGIDKVQTAYLMRKLFTNYTKNVTKHKPDSYFKRILLARGTMIIVFVNVSVFFLFDIEAFLVNILLVSYMILYVFTRYRKSYFSINEEYLTVGKGFVDTTTQIMELHKIQSVELTQTFFQRRREVASVKVATASKALVILHIPLEKAKQLTNYMLFKVASQNRNWM